VFPSYTNSNAVGWQYDYYHLKLLLPANNYNSVYIMRRERTASPQTNSPYYGIGRWEAIRVTKNSTTNNTAYPGMNLTITGDILEINLRRPQGIAKFNAGFSPTNGQPLLDSRYTVFEPPLAGEQNHEFVVWIEKTDGNQSQYLLKLPQLNKIALTYVVKGDPNAATKEAWSTYETYPVTPTNYYRNITQFDAWRDSWRAAISPSYNLVTWNYQDLPGGTRSVSTYTIPDPGSKVM
jgi:hypothetical protein